MPNRTRDKNVNLSFFSFFPRATIRDKEKEERQRRATSPGNNKKKTAHATGKVASQEKAKAKKKEDTTRGRPDRAFFLEKEKKTHFPNSFPCAHHAFRLSFCVWSTRFAQPGTGKNTCGTLWDLSFFFTLSCEEE
nr:hypothetical protein [Pandoravirus aubagnensis]